MIIHLVLTTLPGREGPLHLAVSELGVVAAESGGSPEKFAAAVARRLGRPLPAATKPACIRLASIVPILEALLAGTARDLTAVPVDLRDRPAFDQAVLLAVRDVPWGQTVSYGEIARRVGAPRAARAVGGAVGRCPIDVLIPCHRVIAADGTLGGFGGDGAVDRDDALERKRLLLLREGVTVARRAV